MNRIARALAAAPFLLPAVAGATPLLSEVFYDATGSDDGQVFVEISGAPGTVLDGLTVEGINGANGSVTVSIVLQGTIGASGLFVLADADSGGATTVVVFDQLANFDFQNGPDSVVLRDGAIVLDSVGYGIFGPGTVFAGEGAPAVDPAAGQSIARIFADVDSGDNASDWQAASPTPGTALLIPEPNLALLLSASLLAVAARCRRRAGVAPLTPPQRPGPGPGARRRAGAHPLHIQRAGVRHGTPRNPGPERITA